MSDFETLLQSIPATAGFPAHLYVLAHDARAREEHLARRKMIRAQLGGCECGYVRGEDVCPRCDLGMSIPIPQQELLGARAMMREFQETLANVGQKIASVAREGAAEIRELAEHMRKIRPEPHAGLNRHARRALVAQRRRTR